MVTTEGVVSNNYKSDLVINEVNASALFELIWAPWQREVASSYLEAHLQG